MTDPADLLEEFEELWNASLARVADMPDWYMMNLQEQQAVSSRIRGELAKYGRENPMGNRLYGGLYSLPPSSSEAG